MRLFGRIRVLRDAENEQGASGATGGGVEDTAKPAAEPEEKSINSQAKKLPWVQKALAAEAKLSKLESEQAEARKRADQTALEQKGQYEQALKMEKDGRAADLAAANAKIKELSLKSALAVEGFRPQATKLFIDNFNPDETSAEDFAKALRADEQHAWLLVDTKQRTPKDPTPASGIGQNQKVDPSWINSSDPKKREAAIAANRDAFWAKARGDSR